MDVDRVPYLVGAILLTMILGMVTGPIAGNANSLLWGALDFLFGRIGDRMDKNTRSRSDLMFRGFLFTSVILLFALFLGEVVSYNARYLMEVFVVSACLTSGSVWYVIIKMYFALEKTGTVDGAYYSLSRSSRVDLNSTDDYGMTRAALSYSATSFDKGMVAPSVWYLIGGVPILLIYVALSFTAWRHGKCFFTKGFGVIPLALEKMMGFITSLFSGFLYTVASALTPTAKLHKALILWWSKKNHIPYEEGGIILSAVSWPLGISIGGPVQDISGHSLKKSWIGPEGASAKLNHKHLQRGIFINVIAHILLILALLVAYIYAGKVL